MIGELYIARNNEIRDWIIEVLKGYRLPFKVYVQPIFQEKSPNQLAYLFGVVCKRVADWTGHTPEEVYHAYKKYFNLEYSEVAGIWALRHKGASGMVTVELEEFAMMIRADAVIELGINIELPNEVFVTELDFSTHDKYVPDFDTEDTYIITKIPRLKFTVDRGKDRRVE